MNVRLFPLLRNHLKIQLLALSFGLILHNAQNSEAADIPKLTQLFTKTFDTHYEPRFCGTNITRLVSSAVEEKIDLQGAYLMKLKSEDFWELQTFSARGHKPGQRRPFFTHWVLYADGWVFDYDFTNEPRITKLSEYLEEMFVPKKKHDLGNYNPENSIRESYRTSLFNAIDYHQNGSSTMGMKIKEHWVHELVDMNELFERVKCKKLFRSSDLPHPPSTS